MSQLFVKSEYLSDLIHLAGKIYEHIERDSIDEWSLYLGDLSGLDQNRNVLQATPPCISEVASVVRPWCSQIAVSAWQGCP